MATFGTRLSHSAVPKEAALRLRCPADSPAVQLSVENPAYIQELQCAYRHYYRCRRDSDWAEGKDVSAIMCLVSPMKRKMVMVPQQDAHPLLTQS